MAGMDKFRKSAQTIKKMINKEDFDWLHVNVGNEGVGKSTLGYHMCKEVDSTFNADRIVFSFKDFRNHIKHSNPGEAIMIDEGAFMLFHRDSMKKETKDTVKLLTGCRSYNQFVLINLPRFFILDSYVRKYRVKTSSKVVSRGSFHFYSPRKTKRIEVDKKHGRVKFPEADYIDGFPKLTSEDWNRYLRKKHTEMIGSLEDEEKKTDEKVEEREIPKIEKIQAMCKQTPNIKNFELAKKFDCDPAYVSKARNRIKLQHTE